MSEQPGQTRPAEAPWFYARDGQRFGPVSDAQLRELASGGGLYPVDLVWRGGMTDGEPAGRVPGLFPPGTVPPPLPVDYITPAPPPDYESARMRMLLPVGRSGWAIAAGYLGLLSLLVFAAPFAILCGVLAIREIRRKPHLHGMGRAIFGIVMGSLSLLEMALLLLRAGM